MRVSLGIRVGCGRQIARNQASRAGRAFRRNCELFQCSQASPTGGAGKHPRRGFLAGRPLRSFRRCSRASSNHSRFSISRCQTAIGLSLLFFSSNNNVLPFTSPRTRGGWSADRRTRFSFCRACEARRPRLRARTFPVRPGPLSALHRGAFQLRTHAALPPVGHRKRQRLPAPSHE